MSRTLVATLQGWCSAVELIGHMVLPVGLEPTTLGLLYRIAFAIVVWTFSSSQWEVPCKVSTHGIDDTLLGISICFHLAFPELAGFSLTYYYVRLLIVKSPLLFQLS